MDTAGLHFVLLTLNFKSTCLLMFTWILQAVFDSYLFTLRSHEECFVLMLQCLDKFTIKDLSVACLLFSCKEIVDI